MTNSVVIPTNWHKLSIATQLANVGAEVGRTISWRKNSSYGDPQICFYRALELLDATIADPKNHNHRLTELCRTRELLVDWYTDNFFNTTDTSWQNYFNAFGFYSNIQGK